MKNFSEFLENRNMYDLEYALKGQGAEHYQCKGKEDAISFLAGKGNVEYAYLFKPGTMNTSEPNGLVFWYSEEKSNNFWNNTYKSNGLKDSVKKDLEKKRILELK